MKSELNYKYPSVPDLRARAQCKIPKFAFEYLDGGCNDDVNLKKKYRSYSSCRTQAKIFS
jgi:L-lactate dehydrogenase (cytochrome)